MQSHCNSVLGRRKNPFPAHLGTSRRAGITIGQALAFGYIAAQHAASTVR
jgi:hypothetical protein